MGAGCRWVLAELVLAAALAVGCSAAGPPSPSPSPTPMPPATSASTFADATCSALQALVRAYGNPDTDSASQLRREFESAIERGDQAGVDSAAAGMADELALGRAHAAVAAGWAPGAEAATAVDQLLVAFQAWVEATRASAGKGLAEAKKAGQTALIAAHGGEAWQALLYGASMPSDAVALLSTCRFWEADGSSPAAVSPVPQP